MKPYGRKHATQLCECKLCGTSRKNDGKNPKSRERRKTKKLLKEETKTKLRPYGSDPEAGTKTKLGQALIKGLREIVADQERSEEIVPYEERNRLHDGDET